MPPGMMCQNACTKKHAVRVFQTGELSLFAKGHCEIEGFVDIDPEELECYIDTSEFSNEQTNM